MRYLTGPHVEEARAALAAERPGLAIASLRLTRQGWDNHTFVLNEEWIVRFPIDAEFPSYPERWVLGALAEISPVPIPRVEWIGAEVSFVGYRMLPGVPMAEAWAELGAAAREAAIDRLVEFCAAMHRALSVEEAKANGVRPEGLDFGYVRLAIRAGYEWQRPAGAALRRVDADGFRPCVLHNDLHGENVLLDPTTGTVTGVIDFGDVGFGDPCVDLNYLCEFDLHGADQIAKRYGGGVDPQRIRDLYFLLTLNDYWDPECRKTERRRYREMIEEYVAAFGSEEP
ncbi:MAG: phosphotransferase family protein [Fimbriimonas sp.]